MLLPVHREKSHTFAAIEFHGEEGGWILAGDLEVLGHVSVSKVTSKFLLSGIERAKQAQKGRVNISRKTAKWRPAQQRPDSRNYRRLPDYFVGTGLVYRGWRNQGVGQAQAHSLTLNQYRHFRELRPVRNPAAQELFPLTFYSAKPPPAVNTVFLGFQACGSISPACATIFIT
jgi:hypothetical protein